MPRAPRSAAAFLVALTFAACGTGSGPGMPDDDPMMLGQPTLNASSRSNDLPSVTLDPNAFFREIMARVNAGLEVQGAEYRLVMAEWFGEDAVGQTVFFFDVGNKQLGAQFVPADPRPPRGGRTNITYTIDQAEGAVDGLTQAQTDAAIDRAMQTWDRETCSTLPIVRVANSGGDLGLVEFFGVPPVGPGQGGSSAVFADVTHAGWLPTGLLPAQVIGVTFTAFFTTTGGQFTDIDNDGKVDVALREILYNDLFVWRVNGNIDIETVALHEAGHGLSQAHFGQAFLTLSNDKLHFAPRAVMNAAYSGLQQRLAGTDNAGHCSIWGSWPNS